MAYTKNAWVKALSRLRSLAGRSRPDNGELGVWADELLDSTSVAALDDAHIGRKLAEIRDFGMPAGDMPRQPFPASFQALRAFLLDGKSEKAQENQCDEVFLSGWQLAVAEAWGIRNPAERAALAASSVVTNADGSHTLQCPCRATASNLANLSQLYRSLTMPGWIGKDVPAPLPHLAGKPLYMRYTGPDCDDAFRQLRTWNAAPVAVKPATDPVKAATQALRVKPEKPDPGIAQLQHQFNSQLAATDHLPAAAE